MRDELSAFAATEPKRDLAAEVSATGLLISLHLPDSLTDAIPLSLGEGSGACLALPVLEASARILDEMATFDAAGVTDKPD